MNYQLVLQFAANSTTDFDRLVTLETTLMERLGEAATVDGHDFGMDKFNIFVLTNEPTTTFTNAYQIILGEGFSNELRSAYRATSGGDYTILWPAGLAEFSVL
jgi:hypothetical protein